MANDNKEENIITRGFGFAVALGALAIGVAAAVANNERTKQLRSEVQGRVDELGRRIDDLSAQARQTIEERRPEIEQTIERGRNVAVEGLEKMKGVVGPGVEKVRDVVEQGAERAQEMVQRFGSNSDTTGSTEGGIEGAARDAYDGVTRMSQGAGDMAQAATGLADDSRTAMGQETRYIGDMAADGEETIRATSYDVQTPPTTGDGILTGYEDTGVTTQERRNAGNEGEDINTVDRQRGNES